MRPTSVSAQPARIQFLLGWQIVQQGDIIRGGKVVIDYDPQRLASWRIEWRDAVIWNIDASALFHPGGQQHTESVLQPIRAHGDQGPVRDYRPKPVVLDVPDDATRLEVWFHTWLDVSGYEESWDSLYGQNYWFDVVPAP